MVWLPDGGKISKIGLCLFVLTDRRTQTDRRTGRHVRMPAYTASDKQFPEVFVTIVAMNQVVLFTILQHFYRAMLCISIASRGKNVAKW